MHHITICYTYAASSSCAFAASTCTSCCAFLTFSMMLPMLPNAAKGFLPPPCSKQQRKLLMLSNNEQFRCHCLAQTTKAIPRLRHPYCRTALESASVDLVTACKYARDFHCSRATRASAGVYIFYPPACLPVGVSAQPNGRPRAQQLPRCTKACHACCSVFCAC